MAVNAKNWQELKKPNTLEKRPSRRRFAGVRCLSQSRWSVALE